MEERGLRFAKLRLIEVEVKAKIVDLEAVTQKLQALGCVLGEPVHQKDQVYIPKGLTVPVESGVNVLRIREQDGKFIFTLKIAVKNQCSRTT